MVYEDAEILYAEVQKAGGELIEEAFEVLFPSSVPLGPGPPAKSLGDEKIIGYNTTFFPRVEVVRITLPDPSQSKANFLKRMQDQQLAFQIGQGGKDGFLLMGADGDSPIVVPRAQGAECAPASGSSLSFSCSGGVAPDTVISIPFFQ
jgi:alpha-mannosidase